jgi:hypothetical protein
MRRRMPRKETSPDGGGGVGQGCEPGQAARAQAATWLLTMWLHGVNVPMGKVICRGDPVKRLVEFPLDQGGSVLIEVDGPLEGPVMRGIGKDRFAVVEEANRTFEDATAAVTPAARSLIARLRAIDDPPDEVGIEFGVQLGAQTGAFIASVAAEANFKVSMIWRHHDAAGG